jgi:hypothetical protein
MNMTNNTKFLILIANLVLIMLCSCNSNGNKSKASDNTGKQVLYENFIEIETSGVNYKIPSPMEMFIFLKNTQAPFLSDKMHKTNKSNTYSTRKSQALNFGIYSADLAYSAVFGDFQSSLNYFNSAKILASSLGLHEGYGEKIASRIDKNLNSIDSLMEISADSYFLGNQFLENQGQNDILGLIIVGGWVEGFYLAIESVDEIDLNSPIIERIADQQVLLENLLGYLRNHDTSRNMKEVIEDLNQIQEVFDALYFNNETTLITEKQFVDISNEVKSLRNTYTN